jgi:signal transduction histidine kinase
MSYRAMKRLLGESGLERKLRVMLGLGTALLVAASFWVYARLTEDLAQDQLQQTGRTLLAAVVVRGHVPGDEAQSALDAYQKRLEQDWKETWKDFVYKVSLADVVDPQGTPDEADAVRRFRADATLKEEFLPDAATRTAIYRGAVRAEASCVQCHRDPAKLGKKAQPNLADGDLLGVVRIRISSEPIISGFHRNRALLLTFALGTTILVSVGSFLIIRYVIVKPVRHLKEVADAIAGGAMNVRSEIQTGDEFEDLSDAFNRMLRNLIGMQDSNQELIAARDGQLGQLAQANLALYESNRVKTDFLHTMSHELRTPLNSIIGFSEVLLNADNLTEKQHRYAANIMTSGQQLMAQINDVLDLSKLEAGKMRVYPMPVEVAELIENSVAQVRQQAEKKTIEIAVAVPPDLPTVKQDAGKLRQILANLLSNAVKFTPEGGKVTVVAVVAEGNLVITVSDTGIGIAAEEQETIFEKFRQSANPLTREQGGTGLGLSIVRELANLLQGDVAVRSDLGRGSTFTVRVAAEWAG